MSDFTVFGGRGFIGSAIVSMLRQLNHSVLVPERGDPDVFKSDLGVVIYCAGSGDCVNSPFSVLDANVIFLAKVLKNAKFSRLVYFSSTRVYMNGTSSNEELDVKVCLSDPRRLFNLTKLVGEELCIRSRRPFLILRPSNVYGVALDSPLFLPSITRNAIIQNRVDMYVSKEYAKDYVSVDDVASATISLAMSSETDGKIINVASGYNVTAGEIADVLIKETGCDMVWHNSVSSDELFPVTDISLIRRYLPSYSPRDVVTDLKSMIDAFRERMVKGE